jgi:hypothetical protein
VGGAQECNPNSGGGRRLQFERVWLQVPAVDPAHKDDVLNLLAVEFSETEAPSGVVLLEFSGGATLRLEVECLEAELADLGSTWTTGHCPAHADIGAGAAKSKRP